MMKHLQKLGKAMMLPVAALPICGILMGLMRLAAKQGMELTITIEGADEEKAAAELQAFLSANL